MFKFGNLVVVNEKKKVILGLEKGLLYTDLSLESLRKFFQWFAQGVILVDTKLVSTLIHPSQLLKGVCFVMSTGNSF